jgi:hypothetical protein
MPAYQTQRPPLQAPAMRGHSFCYYHSKVHSIGADPSVKFGNLQLPPPEDPAAIQLSVARIADAVINGRLDLNKAGNLLYGLQIASQFIDRKNFFYAPDAVQSAEQDSQGNELALDQYVCKDKDDCNDCPYSDDCPRCVPAGDDEDDED